MLQAIIIMVSLKVCVESKICSNKSYVISKKT